MAHADDDGPSQHHARRAAAHHRTQQRLAPSQGQSEEAETWAWGSQGQSTLQSHVRHAVSKVVARAEVAPGQRSYATPHTEYKFELFYYVGDFLSLLHFKAAWKLISFNTLGRFKYLIMYQVVCDCTCIASSSFCLFSSPIFDLCPLFFCCNSA